MTELIYLVDFSGAMIACSGRQCEAVNNSSIPPSIQLIEILICRTDYAPSIDRLQAVGGGREVSRGDGLSKPTVVWVNPDSG
jgi:hypothetical protein